MKTLAEWYQDRAEQRNWQLFLERTRNAAVEHAQKWGPVLWSDNIASAEAADTPETVPWWIRYRDTARARYHALRTHWTPARHKQIASWERADAARVYVLRTAARIWRDDGWAPPVHLRMDGHGRWRVEVMK